MKYSMKIIIFFVTFDVAICVDPTSSRLAELEKAKKQEAALARAIQRAETITESYEGIKVRFVRISSPMKAWCISIKTATSSRLFCFLGLPLFK